MSHSDNLDGIRRAIRLLEQANTDAVTSPTVNESASEGSCPQRVKGPQAKGVM